MSLAKLVQQLHHKAQMFLCPDICDFVRKSILLQFSMVIILSLGGVRLPVLENMIEENYIFTRQKLFI